MARKWTEEQRRAQSERIKASWQDPEVRARRSAAIKAAHADPETKAKMSAGAMGNTRGKANKGKTHPNAKALGMGRPLGSKMSNETKAKMSVSAKRAWLSQERRSTKAIQQYKPSNLERRVQDVLSGMNLTFVIHPHVVIEGLHIVPDLFLPNYNIYLEINGCYWHGCSCLKKSLKRQKKIDKIRREILTEAGLDVRVVWEHDINGNIVEAVRHAIS